MTTTSIPNVYAWLQLPKPIELVDKALAAVESKTDEELKLCRRIAEEYVKASGSSGVSPSALEDRLNNKLPYEACIVLLDGETGNLQATMDALDLEPEHQKLFDGLAEKLLNALFASR